MLQATAAPWKGPTGAQGRGADPGWELGAFTLTWPQRAAAAALSWGKFFYYPGTKRNAIALLWFQATCHIDWDYALVAQYPLISGYFLHTAKGSVLV